MTITIFVRNDLDLNLEHPKDIIQSILFWLRWISRDQLCIKRVFNHHSISNSSKVMTNLETLGGHFEFFNFEGQKLKIRPDFLIPFTLRVHSMCLPYIIIWTE